MPYKNIEDRRKCSLRSRLKNKDKIIFRSHRYYEENKEEKKEWQRKYNFTNKTTISNRNRNFREKHPFKELCRSTNSNSKKRGRTERITYMDLYKLAKKQKCRCALTGDKLCRDNISVDHIIPISKGGNNTIENIRLICFDVNIIKNSLLDSDFFTICKKIVNYNKL